MKFTSIPKKLVLTGMSAAMVVAFAPAVASAEVYQADPTSTASTTVVAGDSVATLTYTQAKRDYTQQFNSDKAETDDDAFQAALVKAAQLQNATNVKVTLNKSVAVNGQDDTKYTMPAKSTNDEWGIIIGGSNVTVDLGGNTITDAKGGNSSVVSFASGGDKLVGKENASATVLALSVDDAAADGEYVYDGTKVENGAPVKATFPTAAENNVKATHSTAGYWVWNLKNKQWDSYTNSADANKAAAATDAEHANAVFQQYTVTYTKTDLGNFAQAQNDTIVNGTISSDKGDTALSDWGKNSKLGKDAKVVYGIDSVVEGVTPSNVAVNAAHDTETDKNALTLEENAAVEATGKDKVVAIKGGNVKVQQSKAEEKAKAKKYDGKVSVTATATQGTSTDAAIAISGETVFVDNNATVTASATAKKDTQDVSHHGEITDVTNYEPATTAVKATVAANLNYGTYTADTAVDASAANGTGTLNYGTYNGYVKGVGEGTIKTLGGRYKYQPNKKIGDKKVLQTKNALKANDADKTVRKVAQNEADSYYYVYRVGKAADTSSDKDKEARVNLTVPTAAKNADNESYVKDDTASYVQDKFLNDYTKALVFTNAGYGQKVNDNNTLKEGTVDVDFSAGYLVPSQKNATAGKYEDAYKHLTDQATANGQTAQGLYQLKAATYYGSHIAKNKVEDVNALTGAPLDVNVNEVQTNSQAKAYKLGDTNAELTFTRPQAIADDAHGTGTFQTADAGFYGITVTTNADAQKQAQAAADKAAADAKAQADKAAKDAQAAIDKAKADYQAQLAQQKAVDAVKAKKVSGLKVKAGKKKATVSWKKASGYKYQVKYRAKNSSKTSDFKYKKTSKNKLTVKGLKTGKYYNFKVRVYKKVNGKTVYGKYTSIVTGKIK